MAHGEEREAREKGPEDDAEDEELYAYARTHGAEELVIAERIHEIGGVVDCKGDKVNSAIT